RANIPKDQRRDFYLYVDEFQNFATDSFESILSEARKYNLNLTIAHQYIAQIESAGESHGIQARLREAVFGNVGTILCGRIGPEDAEIMERVFKPTFDQSDLLNIDRFHASTVLSIDNVASKPFDMKLIPPKKGGDPRLAAAIRETSRMNYGRDKQLVNQEVLNRMQLGKPVLRPRVSRRPLSR
ncbi:TraM recognition domain-containing protein, partial [Patescibacteria group bacterium]